MVRDYVGARYVPRFIDEPWNDTTKYEALDVVNNGQGTSYIAKIPVPVGTPLSNTTYWFVYGATSGAIINLQNQIDVLKHISLNPKDFGATCDKDVDDSSAMQALLDFALANNVAYINFAGIEEISFKNAEIKSSVKIDFGTCKVYGVAGTDNRVYTLFTADDTDIDIVITGGEFIGKGGNAASTNATVEANPPLFDISGANSLVIKDGYYHNINNTNESVTASTPMVDRCGTLFRIHDSKFTSLEHNTIEYVYGSELIFILDDDLNREDINAEIKNNLILDTTTTPVTFIGNNVEVCGNVYKFDYNGSVANLFGLNVYVHDELVDGYFYNGYDNCEDTCFQSKNFIVENVIVKETNYCVRASANNVRLSNIYIKQVGSHVTILGHYLDGYGASTAIHKDIATTDLKDCTFTIENCNMEHLDGDVSMFLGNPANIKPLLNIINCVTPKTSNTTRKTSLFNAKHFDVRIRGCKIYTRINIGFSSSTRVAAFIDNDLPVNSLVITDNQIVDTYTGDEAYVCAGAANCDTIIENNIAESTATVTSYPNTFTSAITDNNIRIVSA